MNATPGEFVAPSTAGREMDALIAELIMGWRVKRREDGGERVLLVHTPGGPIELTIDSDGHCWREIAVRSFWDGDLPAYSTREKAALTALARLGGIVHITRMAPDDWRVRIGDGKECWAETLPLALCRAMIAAVAVKEASHA